MNIVNTPDNRALAAAVNSRIKADARLEAAKAALWRLGGLGLLALLVGLGIGAAFFGYSYVNDSRTSTDKITEAMVKALERASLRTTGEVKLTDGAAVELKPGATVGMDPQAKVRIDPDAAVKIPGGLRPDLPRPSPEQLRPSAAPPSKARVMTEFTIFKSVDFGRGSVVTGWKFDDSEQAAPAYQYCYYTESIEDAAALKIDLGQQGKIVQGTRSRPGLDTAAAFDNCVWWSAPANARGAL